MIKKQDTHLLNWFDFYVHDITEKNNLFFSLEKKQVREVLFSIMINVLEIRNPIKKPSLICMYIHDWLLAYNTEK